jgi:hypothetical protein
LFNQTNETNPINQITVYFNILLAAQAWDIEGWGAAAATEAQWCHPFETYEIPVIVPATN